MDKESWKRWGERFRILAKENGETLATVAENMGLAESTLRSWTNGTREVNLTDFIAMCIAARVHPSMVLFEGPPMDAETLRQINALAKVAFKSDSGIGPEPQTITKKPKPKQAA